REWKVLDGRSHVNRSRTSYSICVPVRLGYLTSTRQITWSVEAEGRVRAARVNVGDGSVTRIEAEPFGNYDLLDGEHAMLFADILELDRGDHVVFLSEKERASLLELIWTYGAPAVVLALLLTALALWRNAARFGPMAAPLDVSRRSLAEQIRGTAKFAVRVGGGRGLHAAMVRALHETARLHLRGYERMPAADRISAISRLAGIDSEELATARASKQHRSAHELRNSVALLDTARRRLMAGAASDGRQGGRRARRIRATFDPLHL
ncbi:MAG TPA: hypothetical protein VE175_02215, partial [Woeseiaceae bacterium]|nr:hypothetical protein [Woeseiaceae bacterium]